MDLNDARSVMTVLAMLTFLGIVGWAFGRGRKAAFDEAAALPFSEEDQPGKTAAATRGLEQRKES